MKPEDFDEIIKNKLTYLTTVPDIGCQEDRIWYKVKSKMMQGPAYTAVALVVLLVLIGSAYLIKRNFFPVRAAEVAIPSTGHVPKQAATPELSAAGNSIRQALAAEGDIKLTRKKEKAHDGKSVLTTRKTRNLSQLQYAGITDSILKEPIVSVRPELSAPDEQFDSVPADLIAVRTPEPKVPVRNESNVSHGSYFTLSSGGSVAGRIRERPLSGRFSLVYGSGFKYSSRQFTFHEELAGQVPVVIPEIPLELRYYLLPRENRFSAFMYVQLMGSFETSHSPELRLQSGAEARYRLWHTPRSASYLFVRFPSPLNQRNILNPVFRPRISSTLPDR